MNEITNCTNCPNHEKIDRSCGHAIWIEITESEAKPNEDFGDAIRASNGNQNHNDVFFKFCSLVHKEKIGEKE